MSISYPTKSGGVARRRPSGGGPTYANDNSVSRVRVTTKALSSGSLTPNAFLPPSVSYGKPLAAPPPVYTAKLYQPDMNDLRAATRVGLAVASAANIAGAVDLIDTAIAMHYTRPGHHPSAGLWRQTHGDYTYGSPYVTYHRSHMASQAYGGVITGQAPPAGRISIFGASVYAPPDHWPELGIWTWNGKNSPSRYAANARYVRTVNPLLASNVGFMLRPIAGVGNVIPYHPNATRGYGGRRGGKPPPIAPTLRWGMTKDGRRWFASDPRPDRRPRRPDRGETQRKLFVSGSQVPGAATVISNFTEYDDLVSALYDALPPEDQQGMYQIHGKNGQKIWVKRWNPSPVQKSVRLFSRVDKIDWTKAIFNIAASKGREVVPAYRGKSIQKLLRKVKAPFGPATIGL